MGNRRIVFRHILPNVFHLVIINFSLGLAAFVQAEVILSFLGLGVTEVPSWGRMIDDAKLELLKGVWWPLLASTVGDLHLLAGGQHLSATRCAMRTRTRRACERH